MSSGVTGNRPWRRWALLVACQLLVAAVLAEVAVRIVATKHRGLRTVLNASIDRTDFSDVETLPDLMDQSMLGFSPFSVEYGFVLNSRSFRTAEYTPRGAPDRFRVVALGDSFTFASGGLPHEDHWPTVLEAELAQRSDRPVEVLRLGVPGTGPAFQLRLWELEAAALEPDVVVLGFFIGNDFVDHQEVRETLDGDRRGFGSRLADWSSLWRLARNLMRVSSSGAVVASAVDVSLEQAQATAGRPVPGYLESFDADRPTFNHGDFVEIEARRMALCLNAEEAAFAELARRVIAVVTKMSAAIEAGGARCIVMLIPDQFQIDEGLVGDILESTGNVREDYDLERPQRVMAPALESAGVEVLDLLPVFRSMGSRTRLYRPRDTHWNRLGNFIAAAALVDVVMPTDGPSWEEIFNDGMETGDAGAWITSNE